MTRTRLLTYTLAGVISAGMIGSAAVAFGRAKERPADEAAFIDNAKITMAQAIATAEQQTGGRAVGAGIEDQDGTVFLEVEVIKDNQRRKVLVDPQSGQVVRTVVNDKDDREHGRENDDD